MKKNKYHILVITIVPTEKKIDGKENCREYAFVLKKVARAHIGEDPQKMDYPEEKVLEKIENRILKILKKPEKRTAQLLYKDTLWDAVRYSYSSKYEYKDKFAGKKRSS